MNAYLDEIDSPVGPVALATDEEGALLGLRFCNDRYRVSLEEELKREGFALLPDEDRTAAACEQLVEYFAGQRCSFDLPVVQRGSDFQEAVWEELSRIPFGETRTYGEVARAIGWPGEAVGGGADTGLALEVPSDPRALREERCQLLGAHQGSLHPALVPPSASPIPFEIISKPR